MRNYTIAWMVTALYWIVGVVLFVDPRTVNITRLHSYAQLGQPRLVAVVMLASSTLATFGLLYRPDPAYWLRLQQFLLTVSVSGAVTAMARSRFGDGVPRPHGFIIADQIPIILMAIFHFPSIIRHTPKGTK